MSTTKLSLIIGGSPVANQVAVRNRLATLCEEAERMAKRLNAAGINMSHNSENGTQTASSLDTACWLHALNQDPSTAEIQQLADEIRATLRRERQLETSLRELGFDPEG